MSELRECPFCGGEAKEEWASCHEFYGHEHQMVAIECTKCEVSLSIDTSCGKDGKPSKGFEFACSCCNDTGAVVRERWNRRAQPAPGAEALKVTVLKVLREHTQNMEGYSYYGSNTGVPEDEYDEIADEIIAAHSGKGTE